MVPEADADSMEIFLLSARAGRFAPCAFRRWLAHLLPVRVGMVPAEGATPAMATTAPRESGDIPAWCSLTDWTRPAPRESGDVPGAGKPASPCCRCFPTSAGMVPAAGASAVVSLKEMILWPVITLIHLTCRGNTACPRVALNVILLSNEKDVRHGTRPLASHPHGVAAPRPEGS